MVEYSGYLIHHGIKGQRWGVRRFQNEDGTYTAAGKNRRNARDRGFRRAKTTDDVNDIVRSLSDKQKEYFNGDPNDKSDYIDKQYARYDGENIAKRFLQKCNEIPVSMLDIRTKTGENHGEIAIATRNGYQGKGYAQKNVQRAVKWLESNGNKTIDELYWIVDSRNEASINLARKNGFVYKEDANSNGINQQTYAYARKNR